MTDSTPAPIAHTWRGVCRCPNSCKYPCGNRFGLKDSEPDRRCYEHGCEHTCDMTDSTPTPEEQIAALTAERDEAWTEALLYKKGRDALHDERDEWRERHDDLVELAERIEAERDRYRDALERIAANRVNCIECNAAYTAMVAIREKVQ